MMKMRKKFCLLLVLCLACMLFNACGTQTTQTAQSQGGVNKTEQESKTETGLFSGEGGWRGKEGIIILLESDGKLGDLWRDIKSRYDNSLAYRTMYYEKWWTKSTHLTFHGKGL